MCGIALSPKKQLIFAGEKVFSVRIHGSGGLSRKIRTIFPGQTVNKSGREWRRRRETRNEKTERNSEGEDGKKRGRRSRRETRGGGRRKRNIQKKKSGADLTTGSGLTITLLLTTKLTVILFLQTVCQTQCFCEASHAAA